MVHLGLILFKCYGLNKSTNQYNYTLFCPFRARTHAFTQIKLTHCINIWFCVCIFVLLYRHLLCYFQPCIVRDVYIYIYISRFTTSAFSIVSHQALTIPEICLKLWFWCCKLARNASWMRDRQTFRQRDSKTEKECESWWIKEWKQKWMVVVWCSIAVAPLNMVFDENISILWGVICAKTVHVRI